MLPGEVIPNILFIFEGGGLAKGHGLGPVV